MMATQTERKWGPTALGLLAMVWFNPSQSEAVAAPLEIYGVAVPLFTPGSPSDLFRFNADGSIDQKWSAAESSFATTIATQGSSLFLGEFEGAIERYDLGGAYQGTFANHGEMAGDFLHAQRLESDEQGNLYEAFLGSGGSRRTSFRLGGDGSIEAEYSHIDLDFPHGIDATANGDVYIVNSSAARLFKFSAGGSYIADFAIPEVDRPSDIAINEATDELYVADSSGNAIVVYDLSLGSPSHIDTLPLPNSPVDVFVEPTSGRIFGAAYDAITDPMFVLSYRGFEISREGELLAVFSEDAPPAEQGIRGIVAIAVPEPSSAIGWAIGACVWGHRRESDSRRGRLYNVAKR
jgi:hypothetical protein